MRWTRGSLRTPRTRYVSVTSGTWLLRRSPEAFSRPLPSEALTFWTGTTKTGDSHVEKLKVRLIWSIVAVVGVASVACGPSEEEYQASLNKIQDLEVQLNQAQTRNAELESSLKDLGDRNAELTGKLTAAGAKTGTLSASLAEKERALEELRQREKQAQARLATFRGMLERFQSMIDSGKLRVRVVRGRMVVELSENILFDSGKAQLKREGQEALTQVAGVLASIPDRDFQITGHTDNIPIRSARFPSNWELSTARAVEVTKFLAAQGVDPSRLSAAGYADTQPVAANDDKEGRQQNRRIEIVLMPNLDELPDLSSLAGS